MMMANKGKYVDWANTMSKQLHKKLVRWTTFQTKIHRVIVKFDVKKDVCHFALVIELLMEFIFEKISIDTNNVRTFYSIATTSKGSALKLKDMMQKNKLLLWLSNRSQKMNLELERHKQKIWQQTMLEPYEEEGEENPLAFKQRWWMKRVLHQTLEITTTFTIPRQQQPQEAIKIPRSPKLVFRA